MQGKFEYEAGGDRERSDNSMEIMVLVAKTAPQSRNNDRGTASKRNPMEKRRGGRTGKASNGDDQVMERTGVKIYDGEDD